MDATIKRILNLLLSRGNLTSFQVASLIDLSEKTVRSRMKILSDELSNSGAELIAKSGTGYQIKVINKDEFEMWIHRVNNDTDFIPGTTSERVDYLLRFLIDSTDYVKIDDLTELLFSSRNTITADLKRVEDTLNRYHLKIIRRSNYGIKIEGSEFNRRLCIANYLLKNNLGSLNKLEQQNELENISLVVYEKMRNHNTKLTENAFENLVVHIFVAYKRILKNQQVEYSDDAKIEMIKIISEEALQISREIVTEIQNHHNIKYNEDEIFYLALHFSGKVNSDSLNSYSQNLVISSSVEKLVIDMLNLINDLLKIDLRDNLELRMSLSQHMVPLDIRLRYNISLKNPILEQVKKEYAFAYTIAITASSILSEYYKKEIPDDEIGFLTVLFALALEERNRKISKYNIVVVCSSGRGTSQLFMYKYKQAFGKYINNIFESTVFELENLNFEKNKIDYVFTTLPLNINLPVPIFEVSPLLDYKEVDNYQRIFANGNESFIYRYFDEKLFIPKLEAQSKMQVLKKMCDLASEYESLPDDYYDLVMKREDLGQTDFGNLVAIPHAYKVIKGKKFVVTAILDKPIFWGHNEVQIVFLVSLTGDDDEDVQQFYKVMMNYLSNIELVKLTMKNPTFENLLDQLKRACKE